MPAATDCRRLWRITWVGVLVVAWMNKRIPYLEMMIAPDELDRATQHVRRHPRRGNASPDLRGNRLEHDVVVGSKLTESPSSLLRQRVANRLRIEHLAILNLGERGRRRPKAVVVGARVSNRGFLNIQRFLGILRRRPIDVGEYQLTVERAQLEAFVLKVFESRRGAGTHEECIPRFDHLFRGVDTETEQLADGHGGRVHLRQRKRGAFKAGVKAFLQERDRMLLHADLTKLIPRFDSLTEAQAARDESRLTGPHSKPTENDSVRRVQVPGMVRRIPTFEVLP